MFFQETEIKCIFAGNLFYAIEHFIFGSVATLESMIMQYNAPKKIWKIAP
jgi:hypothetical protein